MLYVTTQNADKTYISQTALNREYAPDGGFFIPESLPVLSDSERYAITAMSACEAIATVLNSFFGLSLTASNVEDALGNHPVQMVPVGHNLQMVEIWHNTKLSMKSTCRSLYSLMTGIPGDEPVGWATVAIRAALLFGICAEGKFSPVHKFDLAISADDAFDFLAVLSARDMGLPVGRILYACNDSDPIWRLVVKGVIPAVPEKNTSLRQAAYEAYRSYVLRGHIDDEQLAELQQTVYADVISSYRVSQIISGIFQTHGYLVNPQAALAYGALQDYRASTRNSRQTVILCKQKPEE